MPPLYPSASQSETRNGRSWYSSCSPSKPTGITTVRQAPVASGPRSSAPTRRRRLTEGAPSMWVRQCDLDAQVEAPLPIPSRIASNEEFIPPVQSPQQKEYEARLLDLSERAAKRQGMDRRAFLRSGSGMAAALVCLNQV